MRYACPCINIYIHNYLIVGKIANPLLHINLDCVVPDELHLMLRVTDVLIRNLIYAALTHDINQLESARRPAKYDINSGKMIGDLINAIRQCGVSFMLNKNEKKGGDKFDFTSLMGKNKVTLLERLPAKLPNCQPFEFCDVIVKYGRYMI